MATRNVAAVDLGAESGRVILARFDGQHLSLEEVHRFPNRPVMLHGHRFWNMLGLWDEILAGLRKARQTAGTLDSIGVDTWGVDYGLVDANGFLLGQPFQYRDHRTDGVMEQVFARVPREVLYRRTGIQFIPINTLFQLYAHEHMQPGELAHANRLLMIPDLLHNDTVLGPRRRGMGHRPARTARHPGCNASIRGRSWHTGRRGSPGMARRP